MPLLSVSVARTTVCCGGAGLLCFGQELLLLLLLLAYSIHTTVCVCASLSLALSVSLHAMATLLQRAGWPGDPAAAGGAMGALRVLAVPLGLAILTLLATSTASGEQCLCGGVVVVSQSPVCVCVCVYVGRCQ